LCEALNTQGDILNSLEEKLVISLQSALKKAEEKGSLVLTTTTLNEITDALVESVKESYAGGVVTPDEMFGVCNVLYHAIEDKKFFDWEMPTLCGYKAEEIKDITDRLRESVSV
jgi:hypothetical protein